MSQPNLNPLNLDSQTVEDLVKMGNVQILFTLVDCIKEGRSVRFRDKDYDVSDMDGLTKALPAFAKTIEHFASEYGIENI